ncbi:17.3 kDa class II heat shock protein-like isoform X4 [Brassica napus]|uniref:17.3 kDa class II heat shock protein-like isoform X4 n=1 Tax=Brassica napus TaxID=3708 RepID=UPI0020795E83|nr:17.3 kDa class II heat shock protein-like isoform X4 [Brassica napus]
MRQASTDQPVPQTGGISLKTSVIRRGDNRLYFARQASSAQGLFMRLASTDQDAASTKSFAIPSSTEQPLLSRPEYAPPQLALTFPRTVWSPRSNVAEYEHNYVMAVELPGGSINDIRVEVDNLNLIVTGRRTAVCQKVDAGTKGSICGYHKQRILQDPFKVSWPLPINVNKDNVSAEFMDGLLRIVIPML